ncbi:MAG: potassium transporter TrkG, partial [Phycisphaeraceae bacterium]|nr:potassium transporter TrkG [Phycisphaeraceae bacterium]
LLRGSWRDVTGDTEFRVYLAMLAIGSAVVVGSLAFSNDPIALTSKTYSQTLPFEKTQLKPVEIESDLANSLEQGVFTTVSIQTTTGFCTADFNRWPFLAVSVLVAMMFIGGCAGSTAGGLKVVRVWLVFKIIYHELEKTFRPNVIRPIKISGGTVDADLKLAILVYVLGVVLLFAIGSLLVMMLEYGKCDYTTAATASVASLFTIGPGLGRVGALESYGWMSSSTKMLLSIMMSLGRLEVFPLIIMLVPGFWRRV